VSTFDTCVHTDNLLQFLDEPGSAPIDLSKATKLTGVVLRLNSWSVRWITTALQTITPEHRDFRQISIHTPHDLILAGGDANVRQVIEEAAYEQCLGLDRLLVQFWESRSILPRVICATQTGEEQDTTYCVGCLLPEITRRGIVVIDLVER
jgi:hypothetical protein